MVPIGRYKMSRGCKYILNVIKTTHKVKNISLWIMMVNHNLNLQTLKRTHLPIRLLVYHHQKYHFLIYKKSWRIKLNQMTSTIKNKCKRSKHFQLLTQKTYFLLRRVFWVLTLKMHWLIHWGWSTYYSPLILRYLMILN